MGVSKLAEVHEIIRKHWVCLLTLPLEVASSWGRECNTEWYVYYRVYLVVLITGGPSSSFYPWIQDLEREGWNEVSGTGMVRWRVSGRAAGGGLEPGEEGSLGVGVGGGVEWSVWCTG